jgi:hypothetical protein
MNTITVRPRGASLGRQAGIPIALSEGNKLLILCSYKKPYT